MQLAALPNFQADLRPDALPAFKAEKSLIRLVGKRT
jgi:hypothetical protein